MAYTVASVERALHLLELLADHPHLGVSDLAQRAGSTKSQVFRLLYTLERRGFVHKDPLMRRYSLGYRMLYLGDKTEEQTSLIRVAHPYLDALVAACSENVHLVVREGVRSVCIAKRESPQPLRLYAEVGRPGPLHAGGASKVLLAHAPADIREQVLGAGLDAFTGQTITDPDALEALLDTIRKSDVYLSENDLDDGAFSIATAVRDYTGEVVAALSVAGPTSRLDDDAAGRYADLVRRHGRDLARALGWTGTPALAASTAVG